MLIFIILLTAICCIGIRLNKTIDLSTYLSRDRTDSIKGIFILLVFLSHINGYIRKSGYAYDTWGDPVYIFLLGTIGQFMVVMFLFYSGYGVMLSIRNKGLPYVRKMPLHRICATLLNFDVAVLLFFIVDLFLGINFPCKQFLLSLLAWESIGNSNWYIFVIILCYTITWISAELMFKRFAGKQNNYFGHFLIAGIFILCSGLVILLYIFKEPWWYNTILAFPCGALYSEYKLYFEKIIRLHYLHSITFLIACFIILFFVHKDPVGLKSNLHAVLFSLLIITITMRVSIENPILKWCGSNLFPLYIYQRIPMLFFAAIVPPHILTHYIFFYVLLCLVITILFAWAYKFWAIRL